VYDPAANAWTPTANTMSSPRAFGGIAPLPDGRDLLVGGLSASTPSVAATTATSDFYSPGTNSFTPGPAMAAPRTLFGIDPLQDGRVLVAGGADVSSSVATTTAAAEIFNPATDSWSPTAPLPQGREALVTALLPDGQVLAAGGIDPTGATVGEAELYTPAGVPAAPTTVSASAGDGSALVTFAPPASDGGTPITGYTVTASTGQTATTPDPRTFATVTGLANGTPVTFTVRAINAQGAGPASAPSNAVTPAAPASGVTPASVAAPKRDRVPTLRLSGLRTRLSRKQFLRGLRFTVMPNEPVSLQMTLLATVNRATIASAFDLMLARRALGASGARRTITLRPSRKLVGKLGLGKLGRVKVELVIVASDAAGSRSTTTRTITIHR
jgi:hypothetical protein